jgi:membrane protease YdiL (CAAX protease family)
MDAMHWDYLLILVFLGAVVPIAGKLRVDRILSRPDISRRDRLRIYFSTVVFQWALVAITSWRLRDHGVDIKDALFGHYRPATVAFATIALVSLVSANQILSLRLLSSRPMELHGKLAQVAQRIFPRDRLERCVFLAVVCTVAFCEEFIFRGFAQSLFAGISGSAVIGIVGSALLFSLAHLYQGRRGLIATCIVGSVFGGARLASQSLVPCVAAHFVIDFIAGYFLPSRIRGVLANGSNDSISPSIIAEHP